MKSQKGIALIALVLIIIIIIVAIGLLISNSNKTTDVSGTPTSDYDYLLKNKPTEEQLASATSIDYRSLYKGANTLNGKFFKITGEIVQVIGDDFCHINMTKTGDYYTYYTDRIQISIIGTPSEILMEGDIISFTGESLGNYSYETALGSENTVPFLRVYAENLKVIGHTD